MSNIFDDMRAMVNLANTTLRAADSVAGDLARLLVGRLRFVPNNLLASLKRELRDYNIHTGEWK